MAMTHTDTAKQSVNNKNKNNMKQSKWKTNKDSNKILKVLRKAVNLFLCQKFSSESVN